MQANYVIAVSGGVDSIVLLDMLARPDRRSTIGGRGLAALRSSLVDPRSNLIVAHFDHGIREDSTADELFVRGVAGKYGLQYETERVELGSGASEQQAREARYNFLRKICKKYKAVLITAHHQDDLLETMLINLIRGTGWRGLISLDSGSDILRPLLNTPKAELLAYARKHKLTWREDSTNSDEIYLRNYIRRSVLPKMITKDPAVKQKLLALNQKNNQLKHIIATELQNITFNYSPSTHHSILPRYQLIMWPPLVAQEVIYFVLTNLDSDWHPTTLQIKRALHFIKTGQAGKRLEISQTLQLHLTSREVQFKKA